MDPHKQIQQIFEKHDLHLSGKEGLVMPAHVFGTPLTERDFEMLTRSGILRQHAEEMCRRVDDSTGREMFGQYGIGDCAGIIYSAFWPGNNNPRELVLRRDNPEMENGKPQRKYLWPPGRGNILLFPPRAQPEWLNDSSMPIVFVEGPKKLLALWNLAWHGLGDSAERPRFLPIAVSGVWNFRGRIGKQTNERGEWVDEKGLIDDFHPISFKGREVTIWYDRNVHDNPEKPGSVSHARNSFAKELRSLGARVLFCDLPTDDHTINGIDDYAGKHGLDAALELYSRRYDPMAKNANTGQPSKINIDEIPSVRTLATAEVEFVIPNLIPEGTITVISGESGAGKTTLTVWLCDAIARGGELFGQRCTQRPVLFLTRENPDTYICDIIKRLGINDGSGTGFIFWGDWLEESPPAPNSPHVKAWVSNCETSPVVVIDSVMAFFDGDNENDSVQMRAFLNQGRALLKAGAAAVIFLHHPGKSETSQDYRGSCDLKPAIDTGYKLTNSGEDELLDQLLLKAFKVRFAKQRRKLVLRYIEQDGRASFSIDERPTAVKETYDQICRRLLEQMPGCIKKQFEKAAMNKGVSQIRARRFLEDGVASGSIRQEKGLHNRMLHTLVTADATIQ